MPWTAPKESSTARGYGTAHRRARTAALNKLRDGDPCCRCNGPMYRAQASRLHLDHTPDRQAYRGLAHAHCNITAGAREGRRRQTKHAIRQVRRRTLLG